MGLLNDIASKVTDAFTPFDPSVFNDPVAMNTAWTPLERGGSNHRTRELVKVSDSRIEFRPSFYLKMAPLAIIAVFLIIAGSVFGTSFKNGGIELAMEQLSNTNPLYIGLGVLVFAGVIFLTIFIMKNIKSPIFDKTCGYYWKGKKAEMGSPDSAPDQYAVKLSDIHAIQIISEGIVSTGRDARYKDRYYRSYEINLVLHSGDRKNITDHSKARYIKQDANELASFLGVPVWDASS